MTGELRVSGEIETADDGTSSRDGNTRVEEMSAIDEIRVVALEETKEDVNEVLARN